MKGYAYVDWDNNVVHKTWHYIQDDNPTFWKDNEHLIQKAYMFDTDNRDVMKLMFASMRGLGIKDRAIMDLSVAIGFDISTFHTDDRRTLGKMK
jgi:hypothetical protein